MASSSDAFYEGRGVPVDLSGVEDALEQLWGPAAETAGGPEREDPAVTRVALANVVLAGFGPEEGRLDETIAAISASYPSRLIVLRPGPEGERRVIAEVAARCHLPAPGRPQVCSEQIILRAGPDALGLLPGAVRSLLEPDLQTVLWVFDDPREVPEPVASRRADVVSELARGASRVVLDRPDPAADSSRLLDDLHRFRDEHSRDIAWFGLTPWRELIAQCFDPPLMGLLERIRSVAVHARAEAAGRPPRAAAWLVAWLAGRLGWDRSERSSAGEGLEATFRGPRGPIVVAIEAERAPVGPVARIAGVVIEVAGDDGAPGPVLRLRRVGDDACEVLVEGLDGDRPPLPRLVLAPESDTSRRVAAALESDRNDPPYRHARPMVEWLLGV